ncbi:MAG: TonB-dependent receptor [Paludibacter sp.]|nr:TonB-dependent receptor [Paludibacter sp.]
MVKQLYKHLRFIVLSFSCMTTFVLSAQTLNIKGVVTANGKPLAKISVAVENGVTQTQTDERGTFAISAEEGKTLVFSGKGYSPEKYNITGDEDFVKIEMKVLAEKDVYQVGYTTRSKTLLTAAVSSLNGDELLKTPVSTVNDAIQGNVTGLTIERTSGNEPGWSLSNFYVRGIGTFGSGNSPLFMVDNVERDITQLDPEEIESITILKDAAATVAYGMNAANGVVAVTTKRGFTGKPEIGLKLNYGLQSPARLPQYLDSKEYVKFRNIALQNDGLSIPSDSRYNPDMYDGTQNPYLYANTDWYEEFVRKTSPQQSYKLSVTGGTESVKYYLLLGVVNQMGIYNYTNENKAYDSNPDYIRYNVKTNTDIQLSDYLSVSLDLGGRLETKKVPLASASNIFTALSTLPPTMPILNEDGSIAGSSVYTTNPYGMLSQGGYQNQYYRYLQGSVNAVQKLDFWVKGLSVNGMFGFDSYKLYGRGKSQGYAVYQQNLDGTYTQYGEDSNLDLSFYNSTDGYYLLMTALGGLAYQRTFGVHDISSDLKYMQSAKSVVGSDPDYKKQTLSGRVTYAYDSRYVAEFGYSYSGSENFEKGNRFGFFPVGSAAWIISNEDFLKQNNILNFLKLRGSYGLVGNSDIGIGRFPYQSQYYLGGGYVFGSGYATSDGAYEGRISNTYITYEKSLNANIGLDAELLNERLTLNLDVFRNNRHDIITTRSDILSSIVGQDLPYENEGSVLNKGFEFAVKYQDRINDFGYFIQANTSFARNEITEKDEVSGLESWEYRTGHSVTQRWGLVADGFFSSQEEIDNWAKSSFGTVKPGDVKYVDQNGDNVIDESDMIPLGHPYIPEWNFGFNLGISYKGFDLSALFAGVANRTLFITNNVFLGMQDNSKITATAYDTWQEGVNESTAKYPRLTTGVVNHNMKNSTIWMQNGNYFRLQNAEIGYNFPNKLLSSLNLRELRVFVNGYNLFSLDHLKKYNVSVDYTDAGITAYPEMKVVNVGANIKF